MSRKRPAPSDEATVLDKDSDDNDDNDSLSNMLEDGLETQPPDEEGASADDNPREEIVVVETVVDEAAPDEAAPDDMSWEEMKAQVAEELKDMQKFMTMGNSWVLKIGDAEFFQSMRNAINDWTVEIAMHVSEITDWLKNSRPIPEITSYKYCLDDLQTDVDERRRQFADFREAMARFEQGAVEMVDDSQA